MKWIRFFLSLCLLPMLGSPAFGNPVRLRCEYVRNPLGIDAAAPRLSWQSDSTERDWRQSGYEILVASEPALLKSGAADVWDSGKISSAESVGIAYGGPKLLSTRRYYWTVRVWDAHSRSSGFAPHAWWEMGLPSPGDWSAQWIQRESPEASADENGMNWIWAAGQDGLHAAGETSIAFRTQFDLPVKPRNAALYLLARGSYVLLVNGRELSAKSDWHSFDLQEIGDLLRSGKNEIEVRLQTGKLSSAPGDKTQPGEPAGIAAMLKIIQADASILRIPSDEKWETRSGNESDWKAAGVTGGWKDQRFGEIPESLPQPAALLRREVNLRKEVQRARLYVTALGSYRFFINGGTVGGDVLTPEYTDYRKRVLYQTYDVTRQLNRGANALGAILGDGWFASSFTWNGEHAFHGPNRLLAQLQIEYADGSSDTIVSDGSWKAAPSAILHSEIYAGEAVDARLEQTGWNRIGFDDRLWMNAAASMAAQTPNLVASLEPSRAKVVMTLQPKTITAASDGSYVFDMGQNMVGWAKLKLTGPAGTTVRLRFAEILNPDGSIYRQNLRNADATDIYTLRGGGPEEFSPFFTFHGFRYVELRGYPGTPKLDSLEGEVVSSIASEPAATLSTSSELVNRMWAIGLWGQRGNFVTVPTDCPQRDERLGWMGDAGVFWRTGTYNFDIASFSEKWIHDVTDAQTPEGAFTNVSPNMLTFDRGIGAPGWGDAGVIVPYTTWMQYGDQQVIEENWGAMNRWMDFIAKANPDFIRKQGVGPNFADWLAPDSGTPKDLIATAYWALIAQQMLEMARAEGKQEDAARYAKLIENIRTAYQKQFLPGDGKVSGGTQTAYVLTLQMKLAPPAEEPALVAHLVGNIEERGTHLSTGFLGTPFLLFTLGDHGRADIAYQLLLNETYPSWGYMISKGATTWWERWNGDTGDPSMNSYNHYAFGSVVAWVYRRVVGIDTDPAAPGFHQIIFRPLLDPRLTHARGEYDSVYGKIYSQWTTAKAVPFALKITVPPNTTAKIFLPRIPNTKVWQDGKRQIKPSTEGDSAILVGSGTYEFTLQ